VVSEAFQTDSVAGITAASAAWATKLLAEKSSKYVADIAMAANGTITVTTGGAAGGLPTDAQGKTIMLAPNVQNAAPVAGVTGAIDWACSTTTNGTATARGLGNIGAGATLPAKYAPAECR
jgi:type IV pilus assembly protein PilA